jgi:hypothetical protein
VGGGKRMRRHENMCKHSSISKIKIKVVEVIFFLPYHTCIQNNDNNTTQLILSILFEGMMKETDQIIAISSKFLISLYDPFYYLTHDKSHHHCSSSHEVEINFRLNAHYQFSIIFLPMYVPLLKLVSSGMVNWKKENRPEAKAHNIMIKASF